MIQESPASCWFRWVCVAFAVVAEGRTANKLTGVLAFVRGLCSANAAFHGGVFLTEISITLGFALATPCKIKFTQCHHSTLPLLVLDQTCQTLRHEHPGAGLSKG